MCPVRILSTLDANIDSPQTILIPQFCPAQISFFVSDDSKPPKVVRSHKSTSLQIEASPLSSSASSHGLQVAKKSSCFRTHLVRHQQVSDLGHQPLENAPAQLLFQLRYSNDRSIYNLVFDLAALSHLNPHFSIPWICCLLIHRSIPKLSSQILELSQLQMLSYTWPILILKNYITCSPQPYCRSPLPIFTFSKNPISHSALNLGMGTTT